MKTREGSLASRPPSDIGGGAAVLRRQLMVWVLLGPLARFLREQRALTATQ